jgi:hypothetical protein
MSGMQLRSSAQEKLVFDTQGAFNYLFLVILNEFLKFRKRVQFFPSPRRIAPFDLWEINSFDIRDIFFEYRWVKNKILIKTNS